MQNVGRAPKQAYQSVLYAAQDEERKESLMQEIWYREGNVETHSMLKSRVEEDKRASLGLCQDRFGSNKRGETEQYCSFR